MDISMAQKLAPRMTTFRANMYVIIYFFKEKTQEIIY